MSFAVDGADPQAWRLLDHTRVAEAYRHALWFRLEPAFLDALRRVERYGVGTIEQALAYVNSHERPLALYWFGENRTVRDQVLAGTISGGVSLGAPMPNQALAS